MPTSRFLPLASLLLALLALVAGCKEKDVPYVVDEDEIARAVKESPEGKELFRSDSLVISNPYVMPTDGASYTDSVLNSRRSIEVRVGDTAVDYGSFGYIREALVRVIDSISVRTTRTKGSSITTSDHQRVLTRHGFFLKFGSDAQAYVGWVLYGFNGYTIIGTDSARIKLNGPDGYLFFGDNGLYNRRLVDIVGPQYVRLTDIRGIPDGGKIRVEVSEVKSNRRPLLTFKTDSGYQNLLLTPRGGNVYMDTVKTPSNNPSLYNVMVLSLINDSTGVTTRGGVFIPYRVP